jgi:hypothetical protein
MVAASMMGCGQVNTRTTSVAASRSSVAVSPSSGSTQMICAAEAQREIATAFGIASSQPVTGSWSGRLYSCRYVYPVGEMGLSVMELPDAAATTVYYAAARRVVTAAVALPGLGEAAFAGPDGSTVVRKDFKVLKIDVSRLPERFGQPPQSRANAAYNVAVIIMSCWKGD